MADVRVLDKHILSTVAEPPKTASTKNYWLSDQSANNFGLRVLADEHNGKTSSINALHTYSSLGRRLGSILVPAVAASSLQPASSPPFLPIC